ncbi:MAG: hypothetical protein U0165_10195 [Polyangiaceae bacterium]
MTLASGSGFQSTSSSTPSALFTFVAGFPLVNSALTRSRYPGSRLGSGG